MDKTPIVEKDVWLAGSMRLVTSSMAVLAFLVILGLMVVSGHSPHLFAAVGFLSLANYLFIHFFPARQPDNYITQTSESERWQVRDYPRPMGCSCCASKHHGQPRD